MKRIEILTKILQAKINQEVIQLKVEPTPFETNYYEFADYSVVQPNLSQIAIFNKETMLITAFDEITDFRTRAITPNDLAKKVCSMTNEELKANEDELDLTLETLKENKKTLQEKELQDFIRDNLNVEADNLTVESILFTAWKNTYGNRKIDYTLNMSELNVLKETIKIIIKESEELVL
jgi:hypothetical protein